MKNFWLRFFALTFLLYGFSAWSYRPLEEALFRNNGNPLLSKEGVSMLVKIQDMRDDESSYLVKFVLSKLDNRKMFQQVFYGSDFRATEVIHFAKSLNFNFKSLNKSSNHLALLFYGLLDMYMANSSDMLMDYFQNLSIPMERTAKQINKDQEKLVSAYINFARRKMRNPKISDSESPLATPGKTSQLLFESFYLPESKRASLSRRDGLFVWLINHDSLEALFEQNSRFMLELNLKDVEVGAKVEGKQTFGGSYLVPKYFYLIDSGTRRYRVEIVAYENFKDSKKQFVKRVDDYTRYAQRSQNTSIAGRFPSFLLR